MQRGTMQRELLALGARITPHPPKHHGMKGTAVVQLGIPASHIPAGAQVAVILHLHHHPLLMCSQGNHQQRRLERVTSVHLRLMQGHAKWCGTGDLMALSGGACLRPARAGLRASSSGLRGCLGCCLSTAERPTGRGISFLRG